MATTVKVVDSNGRAVPKVKVQLWLSSNNEIKYTDSEGKAYFDYGPGSGTLYCDGQDTRRDTYSNNITVTYQSGRYA